MRVCIKCHVEQPIEEFGQHSVSKKPLNRCRSCRAAYQRAYQKNRWDNEPGFRERLLAVNKKNKFLAQYGMTPDDAKAMLASQGGVCVICRRVPRKPTVDHDHTTGAVRSILCHTCNIAIGLFGTTSRPSSMQPVISKLTSRLATPSAVRLQPKPERNMLNPLSLGAARIWFRPTWKTDLSRSGYPAVDVSVEV